MGGSGQAQNMNNPSGQGTQGNLGQGFDNNQGNLGQGFDNTGMQARLVLVTLYFGACNIAARQGILVSVRGLTCPDLSLERSLRGLVHIYRTRHLEPSCRYSKL